MNNRERVVLLQLLAEDLEPLPLAADITEYLHTLNSMPDKQTTPSENFVAAEPSEDLGGGLKLTRLEVKMESLNDAELRKIMHDNATMPAKVAMRAVADAATRKARTRCSG